LKNNKKAQKIGILPKKQDKSPFFLINDRKKGHRLSKNKNLQEFTGGQTDICPWRVVQWEGRGYNSTKTSIIFKISIFPVLEVHAR